MILYWRRFLLGLIFNITGFLRLFLITQVGSDLLCLRFWRRGEVPRWLQFRHVRLFQLWLRRWTLHLLFIICILFVLDWLELNWILRVFTSGKTFSLLNIDTVHFQRQMLIFICDNKFAKISFLFYFPQFGI